MGSKDIVVVGSCMIDFICYAPRLPQQGETIHGTKFVTAFGGKGANQCLAAAKLGGKTVLIARVGDDIWGDKYIENLKQQNVATKFIEKTANKASGIAQITVAESGDNQIVIVAGANQDLSVQDVEKAQNVITSADVLVAQLETALPPVIRAIQLCQGISILNGAPALSPYDPDLLKLPTIFCVNETEAAIFTGLPVNTRKEAESAIRALIAQGCNSVVLTLGAQGALYLEAGAGKSLVSVDCPVVNCADSTGAGDAFIGAFAFLLANFKQASMEEILKTACIVASDSCTRLGTQSSFPNRDILETCSFKQGDTK